MYKIITLSILSLMINSNANALSCVHGLYDSLPSHLATDVPINVQPHLWFTPENSIREITLENGSNGEIIPVEIVRLTGAEVIRLEPAEELQADTQYKILIHYPEYPSFDVVHTFFTGDQVDNEVPLSPEILQIDSDSEILWGMSKWLDIEIDSDENNVYRVEVATNSEFQNSEIIYTTSASSILSVGQWDCLSNMEMETNLVKWVKVSAIDIAGNESQETPESYQYGCSSLVQPAHTLLVVLSLPLIALRRRKEKMISVK